MTLIIILLSLGFERFLKISTILRPFNWVSAYLEFIAQKLAHSWLGKSWQGLILSIVPVLLIVLLIELLVKSWYHGFGGFIFDILVLVYCFGPNSFYPNRQRYFDAVKAGNSEEQTNILGHFVSAASAGGASQDTSQDTSQAQAMCSAIFVAANRQIVAVLFWFIILGPVGAVLYRMADTIYQTAHKADNSLDYENATLTLRQLLEWIPARILSFIYMLVGNFNEVIKIWIQYVWRGLSTSDEMLSACGIASTQTITAPDGEQTEVTAQVKFAFNVVDHAIIVILALIAVFSLGYWLN